MKGRYICFNLLHLLHSFEFHLDNRADTARGAKIESVITARAANASSTRHCTPRAADSRLRLEQGGSEERLAVGSGGEGLYNNTTATTTATSIHNHCGTAGARYSLAPRDCYGRIYDCERRIHTPCHERPTPPDSLLTAPPILVSFRRKNSLELNRHYPCRVATNTRLRHRHNRIGRPPLRPYPKSTPCDTPLTPPPAHAPCPHLARTS